MRLLELTSIGNNEYCMRFEQEGKNFQMPFTVDGDSIAELQLWKECHGEKATDLLRKCITTFHEAKASLTRQLSPIPATGPHGVRYTLVNKTMIPIRIRALGPKTDRISAYRVSFEQGDKAVDYDFEVTDHQGFEGLGWEHQFWLDMGGELDLGRPLFDSILNFYRLDKALN